MTETEEVKPREKSQRSAACPGTAGGVLWCMGWLFTIAFANLIWWKALLALFIWPYYLGLILR